MSQSRVVRPLTRRRHDVDPHRAESRVSAYVYGTVLVLAAVVGVSPEAVDSGAGVVVVLGTVLSTYVAHVLAHTVGSLLTGGRHVELRNAVRDATPILSSGALPALVLLVTALGWPSEAWGQSLAAAVGLVRVAGIGVVHRRLQADVPFGRAVAVGAVAAAVALLVVVLKLTLTH
ncbi:hypothetical protein [Klenkia taihuensis]|uniref:Uncharacterized protein n=1 Tax=Klenkia taihuensis TaxID=1225127 RepID=A0A1I1HBV4_9ACTN|nr:hypothetical protein [Klenkia taihuensis]GHE09271.1 hypothetical protein GCM10011381_13390 [Klenkia taihuensis]SFC21434.1 hypothetical protein SAMN05661030_0396 [Klenkia taihuensis]